MGSKNVFLSTFAHSQTNEQLKEKVQATENACNHDEGHMPGLQI